MNILNELHYFPRKKTKTIILSKFKIIVVVIMYVCTNTISLKSRNQVE